jgi:hypothetical protein
MHDNRSSVRREKFPRSANVPRAGRMLAFPVRQPVFADAGIAHVARS